jgi:hypothetical protein
MLSWYARILHRRCRSRLTHSFSISRRRVNVAAGYCHAELPEDLEQLCLPEGVNRRLHELLDRQDRGETLTPDERQEAEGLVNLAELLSLFRLRAQRNAEHGSDAQ